jgi:uncharacterized membrane protein YkoI
MTGFKVTHAAMAAVLLLSAGAALAEHERDTKREKVAALQAAKVPLSDAIGLAERASGGKVAKIEIDREEGASAYEVKALGTEGKVRLLLDAATGKVLRNERKDASGKDRATLSSLASAKTTLGQAVESAEQKAAGKAIAAGFEDQSGHGGAVFEVDVARGDAVQRVWVDAASGKVVDTASAEKKHDAEEHEDGDDHDD